LGAGLGTTFRGEHSSHQVQDKISSFKALLWKRMQATSFLNDAESLTTYGCVLWYSQIIYIRPYSLNIITAFFFATECSDVTAFVWERVHATILSYVTWPWPGLQSVSYSGCSVVPSVTG